MYPRSSINTKRRRVNIDSSDSEEDSPNIMEPMTDHQGALPHSLESAQPTQEAALPEPESEEIPDEVSAILNSYALRSEGNQVLENADEICAELLKSCQSKSTKKTYAGEQKAFVEWLKDQRRYPADSRMVINEEKLLVYLNSCVVGRRKKGKRQGVIGIQAVKNVVNAVVDLHNRQVAQKTNSYPNPRGKSVSQYLNYLAREEHRREREDFVDPQIGTAADAYSRSQFVDLANSFFDMSSKICLRSRAMSMMEGMSVLRGQSVRYLELSHLQLIEIERLGPSPCKGINLILNRGKTNQVNRKLTSGFIRSKNVETCAVGALALYFYQRFSVGNESFPDLSEPSKWYQVKVFSTGRENPMSYSTHAKHTKVALNISDISTSKVTHAGRKSVTHIPIRVLMHIMVLTLPV